MNTKIFIIGNSDHQDGGVFSYCTGYVRNVVRQHNGPSKVLHATPTNPGDSGGPLFNDNDEVVGLVSNGTDGMSAAEVRYYARQVMEEAKNGVTPSKTAPRREPQVLDYAVDVIDVKAMLNGLPKEIPAPVADAPVKPGEMVKTVTGKLTNTDPLDSQRTKCHSKVIEIALKAGQTYVIDLISGDGQPSPTNPGYFDTYLRIEDAQGNEMAKNDDGGTGHNSRLEYQPAQDATLRIIVTSYADGATGDFTLEVRQKAK